MLAAKTISSKSARFFPVLARSMTLSSKNSPAVSTSNEDVQIDSTTVSNVYPAEALSGVPPEISRRSVRIYKPARTATQQGNFKDTWKIDFDTLDRWENPLMGWASSGDPVQSTNIKFNTKEEAILFAERQGYDYWIQEPKKLAFRKKLYADNFI
ncbi:hypothetical protein HK096_009464, partial [Nowakowskiella sp. JEL0078]